jgi:hypothetical protein
MSNLHEALSQILEGYRTNIAGYERTVDLLEALNKGLPYMNDQQTFFDVLRSELLSEPYSHLTPPHLRRSAHEVIIRAWARFGPVAELPAMVFALLRWNDPVGMESWGRKIAPEFIASLTLYRKRFPPAALDFIKAQSVMFTSERSTGLTGSQFPNTLIEVVEKLDRAVKQIEFERFEETIVGTTQEASPASDLHGLLMSAGLDLRLAEAIEKAKEYLRSTGAFDTKIGGDLLRTSIDVAHRALVTEIVRITGTPYAGKDKDGDRRVYLRMVGIMTLAEEKLFSSIYTYISEESSHKLDAVKETMLVVERTVTDYHILLLRRFIDIKQQHGP